MDDKPPLYSVVDESPPKYGATVIPSPNAGGDPGVHTYNRAQQLLTVADPGIYCGCFPCCDIEPGRRLWTGATARICFPGLPARAFCGESGGDGALKFQRPSGSEVTVNFGFHHPIGVCCAGHEYHKMGQAEYGGTDTAIFFLLAYPLLPVELFVFWILTGFWCCTVKPCSEQPVSDTFATRYPHRLIQKRRGYIPPTDVPVRFHPALIVADATCLPCVECCMPSGAIS
eukprot:m.8403 g.8403  ORF g.8403 m.8403 type:complete len:229 (-) comp4059_c0_seq1:286-972(-)